MSAKTRNEKYLELKFRCEDQQNVIFSLTRENVYLNKELESVQDELSKVKSILQPSLVGYQPTEYGDNSTPPTGGSNIVIPKLPPPPKSGKQI